MKKKKMIKTAGLLLLCLLISACGKMIADEPVTPMPKKEDLRSTKQKPADNKAQTPVQETKKTPEQTAPDESLSFGIGGY